MIKNVLLKDLILDFESGARPKGGANDIPSLGGQHLNSDGTLKLADMRYISNENYGKMKKGKIIPGDILVVKDGATTGKVTFIDDTFPYEKAVINEHLFRIQVDPEKVIPQYVYLFLNSKMGKQEILKDFRGATVGGISRNFVNLVKVPLIEDITQQEKMVNILEKVKKVVLLKNHQIKALSDLKQSVFNDMFGDPITNEKNWSKRKLSDLGVWQSGGTPARKYAEYFEGDIPWLSSGELNNTYTYDSLEHITEKAITNSAAKIIEEGSLLLGMYDTAGLKSTISKVKCACNQAIAFSKLNNNIVSTEFVYFVIQTTKEYIKNQQRGVRQKNFNLTMIKNLEIIMPPLEQQLSFEMKFKEIELKELLLKKSINSYTHLYDSLMEKVFTGEF